MPREKVHITKNPVFSEHLNIRITDLNYGNHLANDKILALAHEARVKFLQSLGYTEINIEGLGIIMSDAVIEYKNQAFYDDPLKIELSLDNYHKKGFEIFYNMVNTDSNKIIARLKTGIVFYDYGLQKTAALPEKFLEKIKDLDKS